MHGRMKRIMLDYDAEIVSTRDANQRPVSAYVPKPLRQNDETAKYMNPEIYRAVTTGNNDAFQKALEDAELSLLTLVSPRWNTVLHIAASLGHSQLVQEILTLCPGLLKSKNSTGDLALHLAASAGHLVIVKTLVDCKVTNAVSSTSRDDNIDANKIVSETTKYCDMVMAKNEENNTAAHVALKNHHYEVAQKLVKANPEVSYSLNKENKSPLYMSVEAGNKELVTLMMNHKFPLKKLNQGKSLVHAAIRARDIDILDALLSHHSCLINSVIDEEGRTPLSFESIGFVEGVGYILNKYIECTYNKDQNGFFPIHVASSNGKIGIIQELIRRCPDSSELLNEQGQNILHVAAMSGKANVMHYMLKIPELAHLINERDHDGNTPLHLASIYNHPKVVSTLAWDKRVRTEAVDNKGKTALDIAENYAGTIPSFQQRLTLAALRHAGAPRGQQLSDIRVNNQNPKQVELGGWEKHKDRVNTLLLVATLVATVTFAAGFTMPGGYNDSDPHHGKVILVKKLAFQVFVISNTLAIYSSIVVAVSLIWAQLGDLNLVVASLNLAMPLLGIALVMVSLAFMTVVQLVVSNLNWLATVILILGSVFILVLMVLFIPLILPSSLSHRMLRYIYYYPFCLLILVTKSDADQDSKY